MVTNDPKTEVLPPAEVADDLPLPSDPIVIFLGGLFVLAMLAAAYVVSEIVGGFTRVTCSTGHAGVSANSQLALRVDHSMKPVNVAESTAIGTACHSL
jgi:hypothetical protein